MAIVYRVRFNYTMFINSEPVDVCDGWEEFKTLEEAQAAVEKWEAKEYPMGTYATIHEF